ncbi:MAG: DUF3368 domain-containing protein [bacterium]
MIVVSNASPLISLAKIKHLDILEKLFLSIHIATEVFEEAASTGPGAAEIAAADWISTVELATPSRLQEWRSQLNLGKGELATILLAKELSADLAIIDEKKARALAQENRLAVVGSIGILEEAYRRHHISNLRTCYQKLLATGTYIAPRLLDASLESFGLEIL